ncbi:MAG: DUF1858 domain-containing protein [Candidatus Wallbacteria bacterium]|nr:DUF1858 domain-containing protein [Candidatus Wallbacteria bacterium]
MINKDMTITSILEKYPEAIAFFSQHNLGCIGCFAATFESLKDGLVAHGFEVDTFVDDLNTFLKLSK